jgi:hypothetical protein
MVLPNPPKNPQVVRALRLLRWMSAGGAAMNKVSSRSRTMALVRSPVSSPQRGSGVARHR